MKNYIIVGFLLSFAFFVLLFKFRPSESGHVDLYMRGTGIAISDYRNFCSFDEFMRLYATAFAHNKKRLTIVLHVDSKNIKDLENISEFLVLNTDNNTILLKVVDDLESYAFGGDGGGSPRKHR